MVQVWNNLTQSFVSKNKYRGREIKTADFSRVLRTFLHDGDHLLIEHIPIIIQKLYNLAAILLQLDGFRFYGCSLLLIYDGDKDTQSHYARHSGDSLDPVEEGDGEVVVRDEFAEHRHRPSLQSRDASDRRSRSVDLTHQHYQQQQQQQQHRHFNQRHQEIPHTSRTQVPRGPNIRRIRGEINIRVVDFAHTTTGRDFFPFPPASDGVEDLGKGYDTRIDESTGLAMARFPPKHRDQPDLGFIFGLKSVCEALREIWLDEMGGLDGTRMREIESGMENAEVFERAFPMGFETGHLST